MGRDILAVDVGTTTFKLGVFTAELEQRFETHRAYEANVYGDGRADIDPELWWQALRDACLEAGSALADVGVVALSVTTPGLTPMAADGSALAPAVLFFDARSRRQAAEIRELVGEARLLAETCNLPVSGGSSLASLLWFRDERPEVWQAAAKFGHTNTYLVRRLTGEWAIDPSSTSITCLYATARNDLGWCTEVLDATGVAEDRLPPLRRSHDVVGPILAPIADELGLPRDCVVLCGGNDAVLGAWSGGVREPGQVSLLSGTCDIAAVCVAEPLGSPTFNVRSHVLPDRWVTFFVLNSGGSAIEWYRSVFCSELTADAFYTRFLPDVLAEHLAVGAAADDRLPTYEPYLAGSRYSLARMTAAFGNLTLGTRREDLLVSLLRGNARYIADHLAEVSARVPVESRVMASGGGLAIRGMLEARERWTPGFTFSFKDQSSLRGAAMLGAAHLTGSFPEPIGSAS